MRRITWMLACTVLVCLTASAEGPPETLLGPQTYELIAGDTETFSESFASDAAGPFVLYLRNGDDESTRVSSATIEVNGTTVVGTGDLTADDKGLSRPVQLEEGDNQIVIELQGGAGSFVTVAVAPQGVRPRFVHGRLVLPWGRDDAERVLVLALKNGSPRFPRMFRVVFFAPNGDVAAASPRIPLPPRGSTALSAEDLIGPGDWNVGSVEIFYAGPGTGRLFGSARQADLPPLPQSEIQPLEQAGFAIFRGMPEPAAQQRVRAR